jgi:hypothetical protein
MKLSNLVYLAKMLKRRVNPTLLLWANKKFNLPAPQLIKVNTLARNGIRKGDWVETGTYLGDTTKFLAKKFPKSLIYSLEPDKKLFQFAKLRLKKFKNIRLVNASSEEYFDKIVKDRRSATNFWLDGHFSGDVTFKGDKISPILIELEIIEKYIKQMPKISVFVDDIRDFNNDLKSGYPSRDLLVNWAIKNNLTWNIEFDIFIAKSR